jgi:hypothetical protein
MKRAITNILSPVKKSSKKRQNRRRSSEVVEPHHSTEAEEYQEVIVDENEALGSAGSRLQMSETSTSQQSSESFFSINMNSMTPEAFANLFSSALEFDHMSTAIRAALKPLTDEIATQINVKVEHVEQTVLEHNKKLIQIDSKIDDLEQNQRKNTLRLIGLAESVQEDTPTKVINFLNQTMKLKIVLSDFDNIHRLPTKGLNNHRDIILKLNSHLAKISILKQRSNLRKLPDRVYINEDLTKARSYIFKCARDAVKQKKIAAAYTRDGTIFIKQTENASPIRVRDENHLNEIISN